MMIQTKLPISNKLKQYAVAADSVEDFVRRYYKAERYFGRGQEYAASLLKSSQEHFEQYGFVMISRHDSVTGKIVAFFGQEQE